MRHIASCAHRPGRWPGRRRRAPGHNNAGNDGTPASRRHQQRARLLRPGALAAAAAGIAVLAAACGGSTPTAVGSSPYQKELAYAHCMRAHGDPGFPDPQSNGAFISTKASRGAFSGPQAQSANKACAHLQGGRVSAVQFRQDVAGALKFVACMRAHGITNYPDPEIDWGTETLQIGFTPASAIDPNSPQFKSVQKACRLPGNGGS
jgi:hypothetical protein